MEVREIQEVCARHPQNDKQRTREQVKRAISSLNRGNAADFYGVRAEHFLHGGEELIRTTTYIIKCLYRADALTDC